MLAPTSPPASARDMHTKSTGFKSQTEKSNIPEIIPKNTNPEPL
jgi:hypothetical protein